MTFLRLGVACAVRDDIGRILLSKRGDLDVWNLPTGRLDQHEPLTTGALREVYEETGIKAEIQRLVGLYYHAGWHRMNILFEARYTGGTLQQETSETRANRFFASDELPTANISQQMVDDVLKRVIAPLRVITMPPDKLRRTKRKLRWRWITNLLHGHLEPRYPRFTVYACQTDCHHNAIQINGNTPLWQQLNVSTDMTLAEIRHNPSDDILYFILNHTGLQPEYHIQA